MLLRYDTKSTNNQREKIDALAFVKIKEICAFKDSFRKVKY